MIKNIINWWHRKTRTVTWAEVCKEMEDMKVRFEITPYYYKVTSGKKTWYWKKDTGGFDGVSWDIA